MESPRLELGQGVGLMPQRLQKAQLLAAFTQHSEGKPLCQHSAATRWACCDHTKRSGACLAIWRHAGREGQPQMPQCRSAAGDGPSSPISPSSDKAKQKIWPYSAKPLRTTHLLGQTTKPPQATQDSSGFTQFPAAEMDTGFLPPSWAYFAAFSLVC